MAAATHFSRSAHLGVVLALAFLCVASATAGDSGSAGDDDMLREIEALATGVVAFQPRHLLQTIQPCPVDFATQNYTVVTSVCNATNPNMTICCERFILFACSFVTYINDPATNCATTMFSYLNMAGDYPSQLFQACQGDEQGLPCPLVPAPSPNPSSATMTAPWSLTTFSLVILFLTLLISTWHFQ